MKIYNIKKLCVWATASIAFIMIMLGLNLQRQDVSADESKWKLYWSDEFSGQELDRDVWTPERGTGWNGWGNGEVQSYTDREKNLKVEDGKLVITALREKYGTTDFTSARIKTQGKKHFKYGKIEARLKVEGGNQKACWPAFWMMGDVPYPWPTCGELDIMEHANDRPYVSGAVHWQSVDASMMWSGMFDGRIYEFKNNKKNGINGWHTYGIIWDKDNITWYVDDEEFFHVDIKDSLASTFREKNYFLLNLALSGRGTGYTGFTEPDPSFKKATMYVDYVRVYKDKQTDSAESKTPTLKTSKDVKVVGLQQKKDAIKVRCTVEPEIDGVPISTYGILCGSEMEQTVESKDLILEGNEVFKHIHAEEEDNMEDEFRKDLSAIYSVYDVTFSKKDALDRTLVFRPYAIMTDGTYNYGKMVKVSYDELEKYLNENG